MGRLLPKSAGGEAAHPGVSGAVILMASASHEGVELTALLLRGPSCPAISDDGGRRIQGRRARRRGVDVRGAGDGGTHPLGEDPGDGQQPVEAIDAVADLVPHRDVLGGLGGLSIDAHMPRLASACRRRTGLDLPHAPQPDVDTSRRRCTWSVVAAGGGTGVSCHGGILSRRLSGGTWEGADAVRLRALGVGPEE